MPGVHAGWGPRPPRAINRLKGWDQPDYRPPVIPGLAERVTEGLPVLVGALKVQPEHSPEVLARVVNVDPGAVAGMTMRRGFNRQKLHSESGVQREAQAKTREFVPLAEVLAEMQAVGEPIALPELGRRLNVRPSKLRETLSRRVRDGDVLVAGQLGQRKYWLAEFDCDDFRARHGVVR